MFIIISYLTFYWTWRYSTVHFSKCQNWIWGYKFFPARAFLDEFGRLHAKKYPSKVYRVCSTSNWSWPDQSGPEFRISFFCLIPTRYSRQPKLCLKLHSHREIWLSSWLKRFRATFTNNRFQPSASKTNILDVVVLTMAEAMSTYASKQNLF